MVMLFNLVCGVIWTCFVHVICKFSCFYANTHLSMELRRKCNTCGRSDRLGVVILVKISMLCLWKYHKRRLGDLTMDYIESMELYTKELHVLVNNVKFVWCTYCKEMQTLTRPNEGQTSCFWDFAHYHFC